MPNNKIKQKKLDKQTQRMYSLHYTHGWSYEKIGIKYGITRQAVYLRLENYIRRFNLN